MAVKRRLIRVKPIVAVIVTCLIISACEPKTSVLNNDFRCFPKFPEVENIDFEDVCEYTEGTAGVLTIVDSTLIVFNVQPGAKKRFNNYSLNSGKLSRGYVSSGRGPGEVMGPIMVGVNDSSLWIQDISLQKVSTIEKRKAINTARAVSFKEYPLKTHYYMMACKENLNFFGVGNISSDYKFQEIDLSTGYVINEYGKIEQTPGDIPIPLFKSAYESFIFAKPTGDKIVLPYRFLDAIEIYDLKTGTGIAIHGPEGYDVEYKPMGNQMTKTEKTRIAFVNGTVTDEYIYLSYSGKKRYDSDYYYGNSIYVYDWDGNPVRKLVLNRYIQGLVVSEDNKTLYAFDVKTGYLIQAAIK